MTRELVGVSIFVIGMGMVFATIILNHRREKRYRAAIVRRIRARRPLALRLIGRIETTKGIPQPGIQIDPCGADGPAQYLHAPYNQH